MDVIGSLLWLWAVGASDNSHSENEFSRWSVTESPGPQGLYHVLSSAGNMWRHYVNIEYLRDLRDLREVKEGPFLRNLRYLREVKEESILRDLREVKLMYRSFIVIDGLWWIYLRANNCHEGESEENKLWT
jgi:hypothetical protein